MADEAFTCNTLISRAATSNPNLIANLELAHCIYPGSGRGLFSINVSQSQGNLRERPSSYSTQTSPAAKLDMAPITTHPLKYSLGETILTRLPLLAFTCSLVIILSPQWKRSNKLLLDPLATGCILKARACHLFFSFNTSMGPLELPTLLDRQAYKNYCERGTENKERQQKSISPIYHPELGHQFHPLLDFYTN
jgi:hypothetical protein